MAWTPSTFKGLQAAGNDEIEAERISPDCWKRGYWLRDQVVRLTDVQRRGKMRRGFGFEVVVVFSRWKGRGEEGEVVVEAELQKSIERKGQGKGRQLQLARIWCERSDVQWLRSAAD